MKTYNRRLRLRLNLVVVIFVLVLQIVGIYVQNTTAQQLKKKGECRAYDCPAVCTSLHSKWWSKVVVTYCWCRSLTATAGVAASTEASITIAQVLSSMRRQCVCFHTAVCSAVPICEYQKNVKSIIRNGTSRATDECVGNEEERCHGWLFMQAYNRHMRNETWKLQSRDFAIVDQYSMFCC